MLKDTIGGSESDIEVKDEQVIPLGLWLPPAVIIVTGDGTDIRSTCRS